MIILYVLAASVFAGILYRAGGADWGNTKVRDIGVPIVMLATIYMLGGWHWSLIPSAIALGGALTTYNKWLGKLLGLGKDDVFWPSWAVTGAFYGMAMLPYAYFTGLWLAFGIRCVALAILTAVWSHFVDEVNLEEGARGAFIIATLPILLIGG